MNIEAPTRGERTRASIAMTRDELKIEIYAINILFLISTRFMFAKHGLRRFDGPNENFISSKCENRPGGEQEGRKKH